MRDFLASLTTPFDPEDFAAANADRNISLLFKKSIALDLLLHVEEATAVGTYDAILQLAPKDELVRHKILAAAKALICGGDARGYVPAH